MEPEVLLQLSQAPVIISCSEPDESRLSRHILLLQDFYVYCLCVNVYCTAATGWQSICSLTNISYHISLLFHLCLHLLCDRLIADDPKKKVTQNVTVQWAAPLLPIKEVPGFNCQPETGYLDRNFRGDRIQSILLA